MTFTELANKYKDLEVYKVATAKEVDFKTEGALKGDRFEMVCEYIYDWFLNSSITIEEAADAFFRAYEDHKFIIDDINDNRDKVDDACNNYLW